MNEARKVDAVFEGGGVKGIGLVGAISVTEEQGYTFENLAGTSAGAIVASLVAAGYRGDEIKTLLEGLDYLKFKDKGWVDKIPLLGPVLSAGFEKGIYEGDFFEEWMRDLMAAQGVRTFGDLVMEAYADEPKYRYKLQVIAADVTRGKLLVLPHDIQDYGINPDQLDVARAVRMSMSIPFFYEPIKLQDAAGRVSYIVDGGVLSNFPVWLLDDGTENPPWPTLGYKLVEPSEGIPRSIRGPISLIKALMSTMMEAHDALYIEDHNFARTIPIPTRGVRTTEFDLSREKSEALYRSGQEAAREFFEGWDFEAYKVNYRAQRAVSRRVRIFPK